MTSKIIAYTNTLNNLSDMENVEWKNDAALSEVMRASSSLPAIFYPKKIGKYLLIDGGISDNLPINLLWNANEKNILAVDLSQDYKKPQNTGIFELTMHTIEIMQLNSKKNLIGKEKFLLTLNFSEEIDLLDFKNMNKLVKVGYNATTEIIPQLKLLFS